ncbi:MAG: CPBP family intramembrane metalloprotease [Bacteroidales bacterium]|nr:CPBP family intramembrane metalloprotease [Bacteroidales bacterium]
MKKSVNLISGIFLTIIIFGLGAIASRNIHLNSEFVPSSFLMHTTMLVFSLIAIFIFTKNGNLKFQFQKVKFKYYIYGGLITILAFIIAQILASGILLAVGIPMDPSDKGHPAFTSMNTLQIFIFVFIYASICEEFLFRGFIQNFFEPLKSIGMRVNKNIFISSPVILSGILFGLSHLILLTTEASGPTIFRIVMMTTFVGFVAGYFQEKHKSLLPAIVIHMTANLPGLIASFML